MNTHAAAPIRIALCITELDPGGAERALVEIVERLDRREFEPVVYCLGPRPADNPASLAARVERSGARLECLGAQARVQFPWIVRRLARQMKADAPQIVHSFLFHANVVAPIAARRAGVPHVITGIRVAERHAAWHLKLARWVDRKVDRHVCVSQSVADFSAAEGGLPKDKLLIIPNGVNLSRFAAAAPCDLTALGLRPGRRAILFVGRLDKQKGLDWLLNLLPRTLQLATEHDLVIVGNGPDRAALEASAASLGLAERVHFVGFRNDVPQLLAASELSLLPSRWEGMPNVVLEAMAAGKPVVATEVEGVTEALGPAAAQQVVRLDHAEAFAAKILAILQNPALAAMLGQANRARAQQFFSAEAMVDRYRQLYRSLAEGH